MATVDSWGRRPLLLYGVSGIVLSLLLLGTTQVAGPGRGWGGAGREEAGAQRPWEVCMVLSLLLLGTTQVRGLAGRRLGRGWQGGGWCPPAVGAAHRAVPALQHSGACRPPLVRLPGCVTMHCPARRRGCCLPALTFPTRPRMHPA